MKKIILKRVSVMVLAIILVISMVSCGSSSDGTKTKTVKAKESGNVIWTRDWDGSSSLASRYEINNAGSIYTITFLDSLDDMPDDAWDFSEAGDGSVMVWLVKNENTDEEYYDMYIAGEGGVDAPSNGNRLFADLPDLISINFNNCFYTGNAINLLGWFWDCRSLQSIDLNSWDVSNVENINYLFSDCESLTEININEWDVSNVKRMAYLFANCESLAEINISEWDVSSVESMMGAFWNCRSLQNIDIHDWNASNVINVSGMFDNCESLTSIDLSNWILPTDNEEFNCWGMFGGCTSLEEVQIGNIDTEDESMWELLTDDTWG